MDKIKILIADAHYMFIRGIESILSEDPSIEIVGKTQNGHEAYELANKYKPHVLLMDENMPVLDGLQTLKRIHMDMPEVKVLMLTVDQNEGKAFEAFHLGAKGYLQKNLLPNELITFIHMVQRGESIICGAVAGKMVDYFSDPHRSEIKPVRTHRRTDILTNREKEILTEVMKGLTNREIAGTLYISENTVKNHLRNIMEKLQMNNRVQAATYALQEGWLQNV